MAEGEIAAVFKALAKEMAGAIERAARKLRALGEETAERAAAGGRSLEEADAAARARFDEIRTKGAPEGRQAGSPARVRLLEELAANGVKHNPDEVIVIGRNGDGKIIFLERGNENAGLQHVMEHAGQFADVGIPREKVSQLVFSAAATGKIVGYQGKGATRPIYELIFEGRSYKVAVTVASNGFIVGANPVGR